MQGHAATPGSRLLNVKDAGHAVPYQHPKQWAKQVLFFLDTAQPVSWAGGAVPIVDRRLLLMHLLALCMLPAMLGQCAGGPCEPLRDTSGDLHPAEGQPLLPVLNPTVPTARCGTHALQRCTNDRRFMDLCRNRPNGRVGR